MHNEDDYMMNKRTTVLYDKLVIMMEIRIISAKPLSKRRRFTFLSYHLFGLKVSIGTIGFLYILRVNIANIEIKMEYR